MMNKRRNMILLPGSIKSISHFIWDILGVLLSLVIIMSSCESLDIKRITKVSTGSDPEKTSISAIIQGTIIEIGEGGIKQHGHCWSKTSKPTIAIDDRTERGPRNTEGTFNSELHVLYPNTQYFVRAYATDNEGTVYGNEISFITLAVPVPAPPTNLTAVAESSSQILLSWTDHADNEVGFKIERSPDQINWVEIAIVGDNITDFQNTDFEPSTTYYYRIRAFNAGGNSDYSNIAIATTCIAPTAITTEQTNIGATIVTLQGIVNPNNYLTEVIFEYGPTPDFGFIKPAIQSPVTGINGIEVSAEVTDLSPNFRYYYRVKAVSCGGTVYGDNLTFVTDPLEVYDANDNVYQVLRIGTQLWTKENLKATTPIDASGDVPLIADEIEWSNLTSPGYCWYNDDARYKDVYGALYNWWAVRLRRLCPEGWHVPDTSDWRVLTDFLGGESVAGGKMKETGLNHWQDPNIDATNESGFTALPGGYRAPDGKFYLIGSFGEFWTSSENSIDGAWFRSLGYNVGTLGSGYDNKKAGYSIRCIKD